MAAGTPRPIIMPMSHPTAKMECTPEEAITATAGAAIFSCGSPQPPVVLDGTTYAANQANNMYIFPGLALGAFLAGGGRVTDHMLMAAAEALPGVISAEELSRARVFPGMERIRDISLHVAEGVVRAVAEEGGVANPGVLRALAKDEAELRRYIHARMYWPSYTSLVVPTGHRDF